uniref:Retrovirus-related Pol polyprotein from transposon opus n=1 Tax=Tanacetum cinerariifolium TaxID=118510 RepID=A0A6L2MXQ8_TANCI|nr:retrovirus-related Pol polyprotein from transposon opus [Tanacetum cinerariifolium]
MDDEPMWGVGRVVALTPGSAITFPETINEFVIKASGIFLYKIPNQAYQILEDKVLLKLKWDKNQKIKLSLKKTVAFAAESSSNFDTDKIMARMDVMTMKMDAQYKKFQSRSKQSNFDDADIPMLREEEAKFMKTFRRTHFFNDFRDRDYNRDNWNSSRRNDYNRDNYQSHSDDKPDLQKQLSDFIKAQHLTNSFVKDTFMDLKKTQNNNKNQQALIQNLEAKFDRLTDKQSGRPSRYLPKMEEDSKVLLILGRPFLHTADAVIRVKQKQLNLEVKTERMIFHIDSAMKHSYSNNDTCFSIDVIDKILEEDFNALLDEGSKILHSVEGTILEEKLFAEFDEFMAMTADENSEFESDTEEPPFEKITFNTDHKIKTSIEEPLTDLELKPLPDNLEYVLLEEPSYLYVIISFQLFEENKNKLPLGKPDSLCIEKNGITIVTNERNELVPTRTVTSWRVCIDYRKLNEATAKVEVFMDDFSVFGSSFDHFLNNLDKMLQRYKDAHLVLNWKKCHFMVKEGIMLGHEVFEAGLEVDKAKIDVISKLPAPTNIKANVSITRVRRTKTSSLCKLSSIQGKNQEFKHGNKVLLFHSKYKFKKPKLRSRWLGPYVVKHQYPSGYVELYGKDGKTFMVNGHRLKLYHEEEDYNDRRETVTPFFLKE